MGEERVEISWYIYENQRAFGQMVIFISESMGVVIYLTFNIPLSETKCGDPTCDSDVASVYNCLEGFHSSDVLHLICNFSRTLQG